ncbi:hypothetical protein M9458_043087, partial [Cirrhinus mrigala]
LPPPWLLPPLAPLWVAFMAVAWVPFVSSCCKSLLSSPWLLPLSDPSWLLPSGLLLLAPPSVQCNCHGSAILQSVLWLEDPSSLPPACESQTPPWLLAPSSPPWPISPPALALSGSSFPPAPPWSSVAPALSWPSGSSVSPWLVGSPSSNRAPPSVALALESSALPPLWLLPPSASKWVALVAAAWVPSGSSCSKSLLSSPWLLPPSDLPWLL